MNKKLDNLEQEITPQAPGFLGEETEDGIILPLEVEVNYKKFDKILEIEGDSLKYKLRVRPDGKKIIRI